MRNFRELEIWKRSFELVKEVYMICEQLPNSEAFGMGTQLKRSAVSIPSNIAEGCGRESNADFKRFIHIAIGSSFELETQLLLVADIYQIELRKQLAELNEIQKMLNGFSKTLKP